MNKLLTLLSVAALILSGCAGSAAPSSPIIKIDSPANGFKTETGKIVAIKGNVSATAIGKVEIWVDGTKLAEAVSPDPQKGSPQIALDNVVWTPVSDGSHIITLKAFGPDGASLGSSDPVSIISIGAPTATPAPLPTQPPAPTPAPATPSPSATPAPLAASLVITNEFANVRSGPATGYALLGQLLKDTAAPVKGRSQDSKWYQIAYEKSPSGLGWVFADLVQPNETALKALVVAAPPLPTLPPATPTAVITATPVAAVSPAPTQPECNPSSPTWRGNEKDNNGEYKFCVIEDLRFIEGGAGDYDRGTNKTLIAAWSLAGVDQLELRIDGQAGCGGDASTGGRSLAVPLKGAFQMNVNQLSPGKWKVGLFVKNQYIHNWLAYGEMYLCIK